MVRDVDETPTEAVDMGFLAADTDAKKILLLHREGINLRGPSLVDGQTHPQQF